MRRGLRARRSVVGVRPSEYYLSGTTDSDYYQGSAGVGGIPRAMRLVGYVTSLPSTSQRVIYMQENASAHGARLFTGYLGVASIHALFGGSGGVQVTSGFTFSASDVGKIFVAHAWEDGTGHLAIGGAEVGTATAAVTVTDPGGTARVTLGRSQHSGGYAGSTIGIVSLCVSSAPMTLSQVAADAAEIMDRTRGMALPAMPSEMLRYVARDIATGGSWRDRTGDDCTLTRTGSPSVTRIG